ncbi:ribonuclease P/MRP protein subunit POP5 [Kwoniella heveanensis BCC8398]|uniref:Ribonuclease P/MRP protein subunit POP5 n=1 Tax=Kwoniella heveanensis BCC8398 TaxID=1296120 RepID=A0A1B9GQG5_9TREE|nr:ribonuclease P/MRP protein subunit POP5 [Kwoniella heveanensis BCC8398]
MVRFKNRYLLVEFLVPSSFSSTIPSSIGPAATAYDPVTQHVTGNPEDIDDEEDDGSDDGGDDELTPIPSLPFLLPTGKLDMNLGDEGASIIYKAVRAVTTEVFGDEGWGRIASSFRVLYHSPLTTLTFLRIARNHYRLLWSALTFLTTLPSSSPKSQSYQLSFNNTNANIAVIPRVIAVSGTIRRLQNRGISYHRSIVGSIISHSHHQGRSTVGLSGGIDGAGKIEKDGEREREEISRLAGDV